MAHLSRWFVLAGSLTSPLETTLRSDNYRCCSFGDPHVLLQGLFYFSPINILSFRGLLRLPASAFNRPTTDASGHAAMDSSSSSAYEGARQRYRAAYQASYEPSPPTSSSSPSSMAEYEAHLRRLQMKSSFSANIKAFQQGLKDLLSSSQSFTKILDNAKMVWLAFAVFCGLFGLLAWVLVPNPGPLTFSERASLYERAVAQLTFDCTGNDQQALATSGSDKGIGIGGVAKLRPAAAAPLEGVDLLVMSTCGDHGARTREAIRRTWGFEATSMGATLRFAVDIQQQGAASVDKCRGELRQEAASPTGLDFPIFIFDSKTGQGLVTSEGGAEDPGMGPPIVCEQNGQGNEDAQRGNKREGQGGGREGGGGTQVSFAAAERRVVSKCQAALFLAAVRSVHTTRSLLYTKEEDRNKRILLTVVDDGTTFVDTTALAERVAKWKEHLLSSPSSPTSYWISNWLHFYSYHRRLLNQVSSHERAGLPPLPAAKWPPSLLGVVAEAEAGIINQNWEPVVADNGTKEKKASSSSSRRPALPLYVPREGGGGAAGDIFPHPLPVTALLQIQARLTVALLDGGAHQQHHLHRIRSQLGLDSLDGTLHALGPAVVAYLASSAHLLPLSQDLSSGRAISFPPLPGKAVPAPLPMDSHGLLRRWLSVGGGGQHNLAAGAFKLFHDPALSLGPGEIEHPWLQEHASRIDRFYSGPSPHYAGPAPTSMAISLSDALEGARKGAAEKARQAEELKRAAEAAAKLGVGLRRANAGAAKSTGAAGEAIAADAPTQIVKLFRAKESAEISKTRHLLVGLCGTGKDAEGDEDDQE